MAGVIKGKVMNTRATPGNQLVVYNEVNCFSGSLKCNEYFTVITERALKHIVDKSTRKVPHSRVFQHSSMLCMNLHE
jgi:hypothetical protein